ERYKNLFEQANDAIILHEINQEGIPGHILEANRVASTVLGYSHKELLTMNISDIDSPAMKERYGEIMMKLETHSYFTFEGELLSREKKIIPVEINAHLYPDQESCLCLSICRDITERKKTENELIHAFKVIEQNMLKMADLNDKIRNPLTIILASCEICAGNRKQQVFDAVQSIDDLISMIDDGWVNSEKVRNYLVKYYALHGYESPLST
ncbi:MAG: hypothetical protein CVU88_07890, partial [Firmicutes bacterium HGW-Firmicutes-13]